MYDVDPEMAQKGCDRDSARDTNFKMVHLRFPFEFSHSGVCDYHMVCNRCKNLKMAQFFISLTFWAILGSIVKFLTIFLILNFRVFQDDTLAVIYWSFMSHKL